MKWSKQQIAMMKTCNAERNKPVNARSKVRAGTKRASFKVKANAIENRVTNTCEKPAKQHKPNQKRASHKPYRRNQAC